MADGTGWLRLNNEGTMSPIIRFNHNLTAANGYTIYANVPFFTNNGTKVDLSTIDFSSQIIIDPNANVTLPAKPRILSSAASGVSSLPPLSSQIEAPPTQTAPTTTSSPSSPTTSTPAPTIIDPQTAAQFAEQDPAFARFQQISDMCMDRWARLQGGFHSTYAQIMTMLLDFYESHHNKKDDNKKK